MEIRPVGAGGGGAGDTPAQYGTALGQSRAQEVLAALKEGADVVHVLASLAGQEDATAVARSFFDTLDGATFPNVTKQLALVVHGHADAVHVLDNLFAAATRDTWPSERTVWFSNQYLNGEIDPDLLQYGNFSNDFLTTLCDTCVIGSTHDGSFTQPLKDGNLLAPIFNALSRNADCAYQYFIAWRGPRRPPRVIEAFLVANPVMGASVLDALAAALRAASTSKNEIVKLLQAIGSVPRHRPRHRLRRCRRR